MCRINLGSLHEFTISSTIDNNDISYRAQFCIIKGSVQSLIGKTRYEITIILSPDAHVISKPGKVNIHESWSGALVRYVGNKQSLDQEG